MGVAKKWKPLSERYILFNQKEHERIQHNVTYAQVEKFILLWNEGFSIDTIYRRLDVHKVTAALMAMDLEMCGAINKRRNGVYGWRFDCEFDDFWKEYKNEIS